MTSKRQQGPDAAAVKLEEKVKQTAYERTALTNSMRSLEFLV